MDDIRYQIVANAAFLIESAGILAIILAAIWATAKYLASFRRETKAYEGFRAHLGRGILVGLEFLVAADIIRTVGVEPSWTNVGTLAAIVLIRTFLSMTLSMEINAWLPWERGGKREAGS